MRLCRIPGKGRRHSGPVKLGLAPGACERGVVLWMVAAAMVMILGVAALAIDLGAFYAARDEAQSAADAAALAGAEEFVTSGYTSGAVDSNTVTTLVTQQAIAVGAEDMVGGQAAQVLSSDVSVDVSVPNNPRVTVTVGRSAARGNALPTLFAKIFGIKTADVAAVATAEAYNPSAGDGPPVASECVKPWLIPDCDPDNKGNPRGVSGCTVAKGSKYWPFIDGDTGAIINPGPVSQGGVVGETVTYTVAPTKGKATGKQYYPADVSGGQGNSYLQEIESCTPVPFACGATVPVLNSVQVSTTNNGIQTLIHAAGQGLNTGQDSIDTSAGPPFTVLAGSQNPYVASGTQIGASDSIVSLPLFDSAQGPGNNSSEVILGFIQLFLTQATSGGEINGIVLNVSGCGQNNQSGQPVEGTTPIPVRLVQ